MSKQGRKQKEVAPQSGATDPTLTGWELTAPAEPAKAERSGDSRYTPFLKYAYEAFQGRYGRKPSWGPKDFKGLKDLLARSNATVEDMCQRFVNFLRSTKQYVRDKGGSLAFFASEFDSFIEGPREDYKPVTFDEQRRKTTDEAMEKILGPGAAEGMLDDMRARLGLTETTSGKLIPMVKAPLPAKTPALPERAGQDAPASKVSTEREQVDERAAKKEQARKEQERKQEQALKKTWDTLGLSPDVVDSVFRGYLQHFVYRNPDAPVKENVDQTVTWCRKWRNHIPPEVLSAKEKLDDAPARKAATA